jgi:hypothetical protein
MTPKGYNLTMSMSDCSGGKIVHFIKGDIDCAVYDDGSFQFSLVTNNMNVLQGGIASPVTNLGHFNNMERKFMKDAERFIND